MLESVSESQSAVKEALDKIRGEWVQTSVQAVEGKLITKMELSREPVTTVEVESSVYVDGQAVVHEANAVEDDRHVLGGGETITQDFKLGRFAVTDTEVGGRKIILNFET
jgi:hypothetical protein